MSRVRWLELSGFRCHEFLRFAPDPGVNVLIGPNGAGKTSILEAISYASTLRSFRGTPDASLIRDESDRGVVRLGFETRSGEGRIEIELPAQGRRKVQVNGKRPSSNAELSKVLAAVAFLPDDLDLVKGSPGVRRELVDDLAARLSPQAGASQREFSRALRQRNTLLKREGRFADADTLAVWDQRLADSGAAVLTHRLETIESLAGPLAQGYGSVAGSGDLRVRYQSSWLGPAPVQSVVEVESRLLEALVARRERDLDVRTTTVGPHRDEPWFELNGRPARYEASQGEQRSVALAVKVASYHLLEERLGRVPVLLLDDVFSELDPSRAEGVLALIPRGQVFVTSARDDEVPLAGRKWSVEPGSIE